MPALARLELSNLRNIQSAALEPAPGFNLIFGDNGSGKTTLLEAIHLLALGRSFRSHLQKGLISDGEAAATVFGQTSDGLTLGISRQLRGPQTIKIGNRKAQGLAELSQCLPLQLINADSFQLLEGSPGERRRFLDWGVFHVEHSFLEYWRRARLALQNRNNLLRQNASAAELEPWTLELVKGAEPMGQLREHYIARYLAVLKPLLPDFGGPRAEPSLQIEYYRGWDKTRPLYDQIQEDLPRDRKYGHTTSGPHRADLHFSIGKIAAADVLSRGQLKLLICILKIAQAQLLEQEARQRCVFLVDDLPAELDKHNRARVCALLAARQTQVFLTSIEASALTAELPQNASSDPKLFHVKHGKIAAVRMSLA